MRKHFKTALEQQELFSTFCVDGITFVVCCDGFVELFRSLSWNAIAAGDFGMEIMEKCEKK